MMGQGVSEGMIQGPPERGGGDGAPFRPKSMTPRVFERMSRYVYGQVGIKLTPAKRIMLEARLQKRLRTLGFDSYEQYAEYLFTARGQALRVAGAEGAAPLAFAVRYLTCHADMERGLLVRHGTLYTGHGAC